MPQEPLALYRRLLATVPEVGDEEAARALRRHLRAGRDAWPPQLRELMDQAAISPGYVTRHLLSIRTFAPDVTKALERGLPLRVARLVNRLEDPSARSAVLEPLWPAAQRASTETALLPRGLSAAIERAARRAVAAQEQAANTEAERGPETLDRAPDADWMPPQPEPVRASRPQGDVWLYPAQTGTLRRAEVLPALVVEGIIATYLPTGGRLIDVTAGAGTIALAARRFGVTTWSSDLRPAAPFVHRADARALFNVPHPGLDQHAGDAMVVHPPTYPSWLDALATHDRSLATMDAYLDEVAAMLNGSIRAVAATGVSIIITRPARANGRVYFTTSHLAQVLEESGLPVVGYHVAAGQDGRGDWHVVVGQRTPGDASQLS